MNSFQFSDEKTETHQLKLKTDRERFIFHFNLVPFLWVHSIFMDPQLEGDT